MRNVVAEISGVAVQTCALPMPVRIEARLRWHGRWAGSSYEFDFAGAAVIEIAGWKSHQLVLRFTCVSHFSCEHLRTACVALGLHEMIDKIYCMIRYHFVQDCILFYRFSAFRLSNPPSNSVTSYSFGYFSMISASFADCSRCSSVSSS